MTQSLNALFSPETNPHPGELLPFRLLCDVLSFYTLPGGNPSQPGQEESETGYTPVQLSAEEQSRFDSLARELNGHEAEFHGGLLASLSAGYGDRDEASVGSLASSLRSGPKSAQPQKAEDAILWQAMLLLKLAEMFREEEREIAQGFLAISGKEAELFAAIRGEETEEEEEYEEEEQALRELAAARGPSGPTINIRRLARAWGRLYTRDAKATEFPLLATTHAELQGLLAEEYENLTGSPAGQLVSLALPAPEAMHEEDDSFAEKFRAATGTAKEHFNRLLVKIAASGTLSAELLAELQGAGNDLNRAALPFLKGSPSEKTLRFYAYEGTSLVDLFASLCGEPQKATATATGLLAVLS